jgi:hypothetical protein
VDPLRINEYAERAAHIHSVPPFCRRLQSDDIHFHLFLGIAQPDVPFLQFVVRNPDEAQRNPGTTSMQSGRTTITRIPFHCIRATSLWRGRTAEGFYDALEWLYGWTATNCLAK